MTPWTSGSEGALFRVHPAPCAANDRKSLLTVDILVEVRTVPLENDP
jgi:hypothetical protein